MVSAVELPVVRLTVAQVHAMLRAGILQEGDPIELIDGLLIRKDRSAHGADPMTIGEKHNLVVKLLARLDPELTRHGCHMQTQGPLTLGLHDEPEPDGAVLRGDPRDYTNALPRGEDASCVIEVADSSLEVDRTRKLALYARAGVPQYVIVNLRDGCVEVHDTPVAERGCYAQTRVARAGERVALRTSDGSTLEIDAGRILPG